MPAQEGLWPDEPPRARPYKGRNRRTLDEQLAAAPERPPAHKIAAARTLADAVDALARRIRDSPPGDSTAYPTNILAAASREYRETCDWLFGDDRDDDGFGAALEAFRAAEARVDPAGSEPTD